MVINLDAEAEASDLRKPKAESRKPNSEGPRTEDDGRNVYRSTPASTKFKNPTFFSALKNAASNEFRANSRN